MRIGEVAARTDVTTKTIRYYESVGLLPEPPRTRSGYRDYDADTIERLRFIRDAQRSGLTLAEIASVLELKQAGARTCEHTVALVRRHLEDVDAQIERLQQARSELARLVARAESLHPAECTDPHRCQIIAGEA